MQASWHLVGALVLTAICAAVLCAVLIADRMPLLQSYALARPNARSSLDVPTPQGGSIAVVVATLTVGFAAALLIPGKPVHADWILFAAVVGIALVGFIDDIRTIEV